MAPRRRNKKLVYASARHRCGKDRMTSDEGMMNAARMMRDAAELNQRAADRIEEAVRQMQVLFDAGYGGTAPRLLEELEKANTTGEAALPAKENA